MIISALKSTGKSLKSLEESLNSSIFLYDLALLTETEISIKLLCLYLCCTIISV